MPALFHPLAGPQAGSAKVEDQQDLLTAIQYEALMDELMAQQGTSSKVYPSLQWSEVRMEVRERALRGPWQTSSTDRRPPALSRAVPRDTRRSSM